MGNALVFITDPLRQPTKKTSCAAGFDLKANTAFDVQPFEKVVISTGVRTSIPQGHYGQIVDKSSFSTRTGLFIAAGIIDSDYEGDIKVVLFNPSPTTKTVAKNTIIAQMIVLPYFTGEVFYAEPSTTSGWTRPSARGYSGFGVTNTNNLPNDLTRNGRS
jgi:dUTP pyrophosphatase